MSDTPRQHINNILNTCVESCVKENRIFAANSICNILDSIERELAAANERAERAESKLKFVFEQHDGTMASVWDLCSIKKRAESAERRAEENAMDTEMLDFLQSHVSAIRDIGWIGGDLRDAIAAARSEERK